MTVVQFSHPTLHNGVQYSVGDQASVDDLDAWRLVNAGYATYVDPPPPPPETPDPYPQYVLHEELPEGGGGGAAGTISIGTLTTGAPGSAVTVVNVGTPEAAILNISIPRGDQGTTGFKGWSPVLAVVPDGARRVLQIVDWTGGEGTEPSSTNQFIGPSGIVGTAAAATDIAGTAGGGGGTLPGEYDLGEDYGATLDGVADDTTETLAALVAAYNAGGGLVTFSGRLRLTGLVTVPRGVTFRGRSRTDDTDDNPTNVVILDGATARLSIGQGNRGGASGGFIVDCNGSGDPAGAVEFTGVFQKLSDISIREPAGVGLYVRAAQNCLIDSVDVLQAGSDGLVVDEGAGGLKFDRCSFGSSVGWDIRVTETTPGSHPTYGYQFGPAHIVFDTCITENYQSGPAAGLLLAECGSRITFRNHGFSNSNDIVFDSGYQIKIMNDKFPTRDTTIEFESCNYHGGVTTKIPTFYVQATNAAKNHLILSGYQHIQYATSVFNSDGASKGSIAGVLSTNNVDTLFGALAGADWKNWRREFRTGSWYRIPVPTGAWDENFGVAVGRDSDLGARVVLDANGVIGFPNGGDFIPVAKISPDVVNALIRLSGRWDEGRVVQTETLFNVPSSGYAYSMNAAAVGPVHTVSVQGAVSIASWVVTNPLQWQEITLLLYRSGSQTWTWPTNFRFANNTPPPLAAGTRTYLTMRHYGPGNLWHEVSRAVDVPNL